MGKIVATYLVKVTVREPDDAPSDQAGGLAYQAPTNDEIANAVAAAVTDLSALPTNATSERTDK